MRPPIRPAYMICTPNLLVDYAYLSRAMRTAPTRRFATKTDLTVTSMPAAPITSSPTYRVYSKYSLDNLSPHPGPEWTRFVCISDTHRKQTPMVDGDVLIHAGDFSSFTNGFRQSLDWIKSLPHGQKMYVSTPICVAGIYTTTLY